MHLKFIAKQFVKMGVQNLFLPIVYRFCRKKQIHADRVIFADAHHTEMPFSMRCLYEELQKTDLQVVTLFSDYGQGSFFENLKNMVRFMKEYANAGWVVLCDNFLPAASCRKRPETKVIQLWHACGALKKFGYDTPEDIPSYYRGNVLKNCDVVTVSAPWCAPHFASAMGLPRERIYPLGISRTDLYYRRDFLEDVKKRFRKLYPQAEGKRVILWAPTFRGNPGLARVCGETAVDRLAESLSGEWCVIKSLHPHLMPKDSPKSPMTAEELLVVTDLLITDYSSIVFDYLIFDRPLVLFSPDLEQYESQRGFYMNYRELPGTLITREEELLEAVRKEWGSDGRKKRREVFEKYMGACDGHATQRVAEMIRGGQAE